MIQFLFHRLPFEKSRRRSKAVLRRTALIKRLGGECMRCGGKFHSSQFDFHHRDPKQKKFQVKYNAMERPLAEIRKEVDKCDLLCKNCHALHHAEQGDRMIW